MTNNTGLILALLLPAFVCAQAAAQAPGAELVPMPSEIKCDAAVNVQSKTVNTVEIQVGDGTAKSFRCAISGAKPAVIALKSTAIKDGILVTNDFGNIRMSGIIVTGSGIPPIHAEFRFAIEKDRIPALKAFLQGK